MNAGFLQTLEQLQAKLDRLRKHSLNEISTRTIVIDPILEALGWDVRDPDEVRLEYPTVDGKAVDYALRINRKPVLLVEAKPLADPLSDVKSVTQVIGYAANDGIVWCVLTNGVRWKVYKSTEECPAPDKLMYEVSIDPHDLSGATNEQVAAQLWRLSREEMAEGTLDELGEQTFTDAKIRKALEAIMLNPPRQFLNLIRKALRDESLRPRNVQESLSRICSAGIPVGAAPAGPLRSGRRERQGRRVALDKPGHGTRGLRKRGAEYDEQHHIRGMPQEVVELYRTIDRLCLSLKPGGIERRFRAKVINYHCDKGIFCSLHVNKGGLRVWLKLKYSRLETPPSFARDVSGVGHWGSGDFELAISSLALVREASPLIRQSFEELGG